MTAVGGIARAMRRATPKAPLRACFEFVHQRPCLLDPRSVALGGEQLERGACLGDGVISPVKRLKDAGEIEGGVSPYLE